MSKTPHKVEMQVLKMREEGVTYKEIQAKTGLSSATVARIVKKGGMQVRAPPDERKPTESGDGISDLVPDAIKKGKSPEPWKCGACKHEWPDDGKPPTACPACGARFADGDPWRCAACRHEWPDDGTTPTKCPGCGGAF